MSYLQKLSRRFIRNSTKASTKQTKPATRRVVQPLEMLEGRVLFSTYIVTTGADGPAPVKPLFGGIYYTNTLRGALTAANAKPDADLIVINPFLKGKIALDPAAGTMQITSNVAIQGFGSNRLSVDAGGAYRVFTVAVGATASISDLTVGNGAAVDNGGGGIRNLGTLTLKNCTIRDSLVMNADGGGVFSNGILNVIGCTFINNKAPTGSGGGLFSAGQAAIINSTFVGNTADFGGAVGNADQHYMLLANCTISGNHALTSGGGLAGTVNDPENTLPTTRLNNTIIAGNTFGQTSGLGPDIYGFFDSASAGNLVGNLGFAKGLNPMINKLGGIEHATPVIDAKLMTLGYYGGGTQTMPPMANSPAVNGGNNALIPTGIKTDQRGYARVFNGTVDIGAVENPSTPGNRYWWL